MSSKKNKNTPNLPSELPALGDQETEVLSFITQYDSITVKEVSLYFEKNKGLARTTILTVMERLRKKGYLKRTKKNGLFVYSANFENYKIIKSKIKSFIEKTLSGSISPLLHYFTENSNLSQDEIDQLTQIVHKASKNSQVNQNDSFT